LVPINVVDLLRLNIFIYVMFGFAQAPREAPATRLVHGERLKDGRLRNAPDYHFTHSLFRCWRGSTLPVQVALLQARTTCWVLACEAVRDSDQLRVQQHLNSLPGRRPHPGIDLRPKYSFQNCSAVVGGSITVQQRGSKALLRSRTFQGCHRTARDAFEKDFAYGRRHLNGAVSTVESCSLIDLTPLFDFFHFGLRNDRLNLQLAVLPAIVYFFRRANDAANIAFAEWPQSFVDYIMTKSFQSAALEKLVPVIHHFVD
jgi:hypothetical protein